MSRDPDGLYACLGVPPDASLGEIRAAFRARARKPHPDAAADGATLRRLSEARDVLTDPARRASYDASGLRPEGFRSRFPGAASAAAGGVETVRCGRCGVVSAQPRYVIFPRATSMLLLCKRAASQGVHCPACAAREATRAALWTWLLGWWSLPGLLWSPRSIWANLRGGEKPAPANVALLARQCLAFAQRGDPRLASACLRQAEAFAQGEDAAALSLLRRDLRLPDAAVRDAWALTRLSLASVRLAPLAVGLAAAWWVLPPLHPRPVMAGPDDGRSAGAAPTPVSPPTGSAPEASTQQRHPIPRHAYVLPDRGAASLWHESESGPVKGERLPAFATGEALGPAANPAYTQVRATAGDVGQVETAQLGSRGGAAANRQWCSEGAGAAPRHNEIAVRRGSGPHHVTINNHSEQWAVVKMRDSGHRTIVAVFVGPRSKAEIENFPSGHFRPEFAFGRHWSRRCGVFLEGVGAQRFPKFSEFPAPPPGARQYTVVSATYTITPVPNGNVRPETISPDDFAKD